MVNMKSFVSFLFKSILSVQFTGKWSHVSSLMYNLTQEALRERKHPPRLVWGPQKSLVWLETV